MVVIVSISSDLIPLLPKEWVNQRMELPEGTACLQLKEALGLKEIPVIVVVNKRVETEDKSLEDGDLVEIFPIMEGG